MRFPLHAGRMGSHSEREGLLHAGPDGLDGPDHYWRSHHAPRRDLNYVLKYSVGLRYFLAHLHQSAWVRRTLHFIFQWADHSHAQRVAQRFFGVGGDEHGFATGIACDSYDKSECPSAATYPLREKLNFQAARRQDIERDRLQGIICRVLTGSYADSEGISACNRDSSGAWLYPQDDFGAVLGEEANVGLGERVPCGVKPQHHEGEGIYDLALVGDADRKSTRLNSSHLVI